MSSLRKSMLVLSLVCVAVATNAFPVAANRSAEGDPATAIYLPLTVVNFVSVMNKIVYASGYTDTHPYHDIYVMNSDGSGKVKLTSNTKASSLFPRWSPDNTQIAFVQFTPDKVSTEQIVVMNADGSYVKTLTVTGAHSYHPTWSPDGKQIIFSSDLFAPGATTPNDLYAVNADGSGGLTNLTNTASLHEANPDWSADGSQIAYARMTYDGTSSQIYVMDPAGGNQHNISNSATYDYAPKWSPDGTQIVYVGDLGDNNNPNRQIFIMNADGTGKTQLTHNAGQNFYPTWSPDGQQIVFQTYYDYNYADIYVMNSDGSGLTDITNTQDAYASVTPDWH